VKLHSIFLRNRCILPGDFDLEPQPFCEDWKATEETAEALDSSVRRAGWHFMWLQNSYSHWACGRTREGAIHRCVECALKKVAGQFNASELDSVQVRRYPGFHYARVTVHARQIQQQTSMRMAGTQ